MVSSDLALFNASNRAFRYLTCILLTILPTGAFGDSYIVCALYHVFKFKKLNTGSRLEEFLKLEFR